MSLKANVEAKLKEIAQKAGAAHVDVGFMAGATYPDGMPVAMVAFLNEFGHRGRSLGPAPHPDAVTEGERREPERAAGAPPRPFFRRMIAEHQSEWTGQLRQAFISTNGDAAKSLALMGETIQGELAESIVTFTTPPLAASTIRRKGFSQPLVDTGHMLQSITYRVR